MLIALECSVQVYSCHHYNNFNSRAGHFNFLYIPISLLIYLSQLRYQNSTCVLHSSSLPPRSQALSSLLQVHPQSLFLLLFSNFPQLTQPAANQSPENEVTSILEALRENNPEDADAAASAMKIKLRHRDAAPQVQPQIDGGEDLNSILAALEANNPEDAAAAKSVQQRRDDLNSIVAALEEKSAKGVQKRQDDLDSILAALEANNPEDAEAARGVQKRQEGLNSVVAALEENKKRMQRLRMV